MDKGLVTVDTKGLDKAQKALDDALKEKNAIVFFHMETCPHCRTMRPLFHNLAEKFGDNIHFLEMEISDNPMSFGTAYKFMFVPVMIYFKEGAEQMRHTGEKKIDEMKELIKKIYDVSQKE